MNYFEKMSEVEQRVLLALLYRREKPVCRAVDEAWMWLIQFLERVATGAIPSFDQEVRQEVPSRLNAKLLTAFQLLNWLLKLKHIPPEEHSKYLENSVRLMARREAIDVWRKRRKDSDEQTGECVGKPTVDDLRKRMDLRDLLSSIEESVLALGAEDRRIPVLFALTFYAGIGSLQEDQLQYIADKNTLQPRLRNQSDVERKLDEFFLENQSTLNAKQLGELLGETEHNIYQMRHRLRMKLISQYGAAFRELAGSLIARVKRGT